MIDNFSFRSFYVIVFELMEINLYNYTKAPCYLGLSKDELCNIAT